MKKLKHIPKFKTEAEERIFWETHDSSPYVDWSLAQLATFPNLKHSINHAQSNQILDERSKN